MTRSQHASKSDRTHHHYTTTKLLRFGDITYCMLYTTNVTDNRGLLKVIRNINVDGQQAPVKDGVPTFSIRISASLAGKVDLNTGTICLNLNLKFCSIQSLIDPDNLSCKISSQK